MSIRIVGGERLDRAFAVIARETDERYAGKVIGRVTLKAARKLAKEVSHAAPVGTTSSHPGRLKKSIVGFRAKKKTGAMIKAAITWASYSGPNKAPHAHLVEGGTKERKPKKGRYMSFIASNGQRVFARRVKGVQATHFFERTFERSGDSILREAVEEMGAGFHDLWRDA